MTTGIAVPLTRLLGAAALVSAGGSLLFPDLLSGERVTIGNLRGTALVVLVVALPLLLTGMTSAGRGSTRGLALWLAADAYLVYQGVLFCFATPFNSLFLAYVALFGLALWNLVVLLRAVDLDELAEQVPTDFPFRAASVALATLVVLNALVWLARIVPASLSDEPTDLLDGSGLLTSPVYVQDLAFWMPAGLVVAALLWVGSPWGALLGTAQLTFYAVEVVSVASDQWWGARADDSYPDLASMAVVAPALVLAALIAVPAGWCLRHLGSSGSRLPAHPASASRPA